MKIIPKHSQHIPGQLAEWQEEIVCEACNGTGRGSGHFEQGGVIKGLCDDCAGFGKRIRNKPGWAHQSDVDEVRAAELAEIEREIGRAVIGNLIVNNSIWLLDKDWTDTNATSKAMAALDKCLTKDGAIGLLIARWRQLHAAGAERGK